MPWKEPGKGGKDPWKSGDQPPDLEEVFDNVNRRVKGLFGGGGSSAGGGLIPILGLLLLVWIGFDSVHVLDEAEEGVVLRFGEYTRTLQPGINVTFPRPIESMMAVNVSNVRSIEDRGQMLTEDENIIEFNYTVQFRVLDPLNFLFRVRDPELTVQAAAESALREAVGTNTLDFILAGSGRQQVAQETQDVLQETLDLYEAGIIVTEFNLVDVNVPAQVREAFSDVNRAREDRQRYIEESRVHMNSVIPEARGQAARILQEAEGYRDATIALADGEADRFTALLEEYAKAPDITRKRLAIQTMEGVFSRSSKVLLDVDSSGNILYLPLDSMGGNTTGSGRSLPPPVMSPEGPGTVERAPDNGRTAGRESRR